MEHAVLPPAPAGKPSRLFSASFESHADRAKAAGVAALLVLLFLSPPVATLSLILLLKPEGPLNHDANTLYLLASTAIFSLVVVGEIIGIRAILQQYDRMLFRQIHAEVQVAERELLTRMDERIAEMVKQELDDLDWDEDDGKSHFAEDIEDSRQLTR